MKKQLLFIALVGLIGLAKAQVPSYRTLPAGLISYGMSPSGTFITGAGGSGAFLYKTTDSTLTSIGGVEGWGVTDNGIVGGTTQGSTPFGTGTMAAIYSAANGWVTLPTVPGGGYLTGTGSYSDVFGISDNGESVCGMFWANAGKTTAFVYSSGTGYTQLQDAGSSARANCISGDGQVAGGWWQGNARVPICWYPGATGSMVSTDGEMFGTNSTGTYVAGYETSTGYQKAVLWDRVNNSALSIPLPAGAMDGQATAVADNMVTVGYTGGFFSGFAGFIHIPGLGTFDLQTYLTNAGATNVGDCGMPQAISRNGRYICGVTGGFPRTAWFVDLGSVPTSISCLNNPIPSLSVYPNPASCGNVVISYEITKGATATAVTIYDLQGKIVRQFSPSNLPTGLSKQVWDLTDEAGSRVPAGTYLAVVEANGARSRATIMVQN